MDEAQRYRELAKVCRERAEERSREWEKITLIGAAEEFERLAQKEERETTRAGASRP